MNNKEHNIGLIPFILTIGVLFPLSEYLLDFFYEDITVTNIYIVQLFLLFGLVFYSTYRRVGLFNVYSFHLITTFIFAFGGIFASFIAPGVVDFRDKSAPLPIHFSEIVSQKVILIYSIYVVFSYLFFFLLRPLFLKNNKPNNLAFKTDNKLFSIGKYGMIFMFPFAMLYAFEMFKVLLGNRTMLYELGSTASFIPIYYRIGNMLFTYSFYILIASVPPIKTFIRYCILVFITLVPSLAMGERGDIVGLIMFIVWYLSRVYQYKFKFSFIVPVVIVIMVAVEIVGITRQGEALSESSLFGLLLGFFATSSTSFPLMAYYVQFKSAVINHPYPFFLDSLIGGLTGASGQSLETLEHRASIGHHLVYTLNPNYYLAGNSLGSSYIAEMYEFGIIGVILGMILLAGFVNFVDTKMFKSRFRMIFAYNFFQCVILSARGSLFPSIYEIIKITIVYVIATSLFGFLFPRSKQYR